MCKLLVWSEVVCLWAVPVYFAGESVRVCESCRFALHFLGLRCEDRVGDEL